MPVVERPDGARIRYEVYGSGYPLLLIAPGGVSSSVESWERSVIKPARLFAAEFMVIAMDQRHAGQSFAPLRPFSYDECNADQLAVLDALGVERAHVYGGCIGCAHIWSLLRNAPQRISAAVAQDPVGLDETNTIETFHAMFRPALRLAREQGVEAVIASAMENPLFVANNAAGPFAPALHELEAARAEARRLGSSGYVELVERFMAGIWPDNPPYFTASDEWFASCQTPILVMPGRDPFHPTGVARRICRIAPKARCLAPDCRDEPNLAGTIESVRTFLREHAARR
jgi:pimeloyl-ACP methyl ester carboxylesterase